MKITYKVNFDFELDQVIQLYHDSTLGDRRPVDDRECMSRMMKEANLIVTAWDNDLLVGISRNLTDFCYIAYLADLAVHESYQKMGIGKELIRRTQAELGTKCRLILLSAPKAAAYYPHIGFSRHPEAWMLAPGEQVR
ncbi:GNAT family N-acetyltransferase [candidate division KSB1 bacterium]|nr:GNAT family N-acetyltransferase [candidate division KSB1 bacterium]